LLNCLTLAVKQLNRPTERGIRKRIRNLESVEKYIPGDSGVNRDTYNSGLLYKQALDNTTMSTPSPSPSPNPNPEHPDDLCFPLGSGTICLAPIVYVGLPILLAVAVAVGIWVLEGWGES
jgi:hypothetical protein